MNKLRSGIRHFHQVKPDELSLWLEEGDLVCTVTEKTDGMAFAFGWDSDREQFYSRTSYSPRTYHPDEYRERAIAKFGDQFNPEISASFMEAHRLLKANVPLANHVRMWNTEFTGEIYLRSQGELDDNGRIKFVGTWYDLQRIPHQATFVLHSKMNEKMPEHHKAWTTPFLKIDDDAVDYSRTLELDHRNIEQAEQDVRLWLSEIPGKWGDEVEGHVLHKDGFQPIKLMNPDFYVNKRSF